MNPTHAAGDSGSDVTSGMLTASNSDEGLVVNLTNFAIPTDSILSLLNGSLSESRLLKCRVKIKPGYELYTREDNEEGIVVRHLFNRDGSHSGNEELSGLKLLQAELHTGVDLNGDNQIGLTVESQVTTGTASNTGLSRYLYNTNEGLLISKPAHCSPKPIPSVMGLRLHQLMKIGHAASQ